MSSTHGRDHSTVDRADLLIMCNKIKEDVKKSFRDTIGSQCQTLTARPESQPVTKREHKNDLRNSIGKYKHAYGITPTHASPVKRIRYNSGRVSARPAHLGSESSRSEERLEDKKPSLDRINLSKYRSDRIKNKQEKDR
mmetsp:Transcript_11864/g.10482  ORF Transcript_11864/g.10482 Transcript_11864/m.10482 type:complete len:139 (-) Transcript_11864:184-600(-)